MENHKGNQLEIWKIQSQGEIVITQSGIEGGGIYSLSPAIRKGEAVVLDLCQIGTKSSLMMPSKTTY